MTKTRRRPVTEVVLVVLAAVLAMAATEGTAQAQSYPAGMVSYWKFEEGGGTTAYDSCDGNDGPISGGPTWPTGMVGGALSFNWINDQIIVGDPPNLEITQQITIEAWVNLSSVPTRDVGTWSGTQTMIRK
ncbi:MAG: hypothetical protein Q8Q12_19010, partial [bacterium]|nr:hypothetical protein [bacterium]